MHGTIVVNSSIGEHTAGTASHINAYSEYMHIWSILGDIATKNMYDLEFDLSRSLKVKFYSVIRKPTYDFLLVNNSDSNMTT